MTPTFSNTDPRVKRVEAQLLDDNAVAIANLATGGTIGTAPVTVDVADVITINQTTAGQTITIPNPTQTTLNYSIPIINIGSTSFTLLSTTISPNAGILVEWGGSAWAVIGTSSGASNVVVVGGKTFTVNNTLTLAGTDGTTMTFPTTSATLARTDAANTFTGVQTMTSPVISGHATIEGVTPSGATGTVNLVFSTSPTLVTPTLGVATATSLNGNTFTTGTYTLTGSASKTLTFTNSITLTGTDSTTMTFPTTSATIARTDAANTFTGVQTFSGALVFTAGLTASGAVANDFSGGSGTFKTSTGANQLSGAVTVTDATTPSITLASGKTNTGFLLINGKTSGALKIIAADAAAQTVTLNLAAQTVGAGTLNIPDMANTTKTVAWLESPTLVTPVIGVATGTSLAVSGLLTSSSATAGIGYATGAGGTVTQATNKSTAVTLNKASGQVTMNNAALANATAVTFTLNNTVIAATDVVHVSIASGTSSAYMITTTATAGGSCTISVYNASGGSLSEALVLNFIVFKAVAA